MNKSVLFVLDPLMGHVTVKIRGTIYKELFECDGWAVEYISRYDFKEKQIVEISSMFNIVYLLKVPSVSLVKELKKNTHTKVVFDLTDALWSPFYRKHGWHKLDEILINVDALFVENDYVSRYAKKWNGNVYIIPACSQVELFDEMRLKMPRREDNKIVIGWVGSTGTVAALDFIREPLEILFAKYSNLELRILGCATKKLPHFKYVRFSTLPEYDERDMIREVLGMDMGIYPPPLDLEDYRVRGALKGLIYMSGGVPAVCQNEGNCKLEIQDGINGMLASTKEEWTAKLEMLIKSPILRHEMGLRGLESVRGRHSLANVYKILEESLLSVIGGN